METLSKKRQSRRGGLEEAVVNMKIFIQIELMLRWLDFDSLATSFP